MAKNTTLHYIIYTLYIHYIHYYLLSELKKFGARSCRAPNVHQTSIGGARNTVHHCARPSYGCALIILQTCVMYFAIYLVTN